MEKTIKKNLEDWEDFAQYFFINSSLNMSIGKISSQIAHAIINNYLENKEEIDFIKKNNSSKILITFVKEKELFKLLSLLKNKFSFKYTAIFDAGKTEVLPNSLTCICLIPYKLKEIYYFLKLIKYRLSYFQK